MKRRHDAGLAPVELTRFLPEEWPASEADLGLMGHSQGLAFHAWIRWLHARADFAGRHNTDADAIPDNTTRAMWRRMEASLGSHAGSTAPRAGSSTP